MHGLPPGETPGPGGEAQATLCVSCPACPGWASDGAQELLLALDEPSQAIPSWALPYSLPLQLLLGQPWAWKPEKDRGEGATSQGLALSRNSA